jgi:restriction endonuclease S subunit
MILDLAKGTAQPNISTNELAKIKIPIPPPEKQKKIVEFLDKLYETKQIKIQDTSSYYENQNIFKLLLNGEYNVFEKLVEWYEQSVILEGQIQFFKDRVERYLYLISKGENEMKTLNELTKINYGKRITKNKNEGTIYNAYGGGDIMSYKVDEYNRDGIIYKIARDGLSRHNCISKIYGKLFLNDTALTLDIKNTNILNNNYLGEFLLSQKNYIYDNCSHGTAQLHIDLEKLMKIKIPVPSLEKQKEIIEYCESNNNLIKKLENEIEQNKIQANLFLSSIVKKVKIEQDELSDNESNLDESETNQNIINEDEEIQEEVQEVIEEVKPKKTKSKKTSATN